MRKITETIVHAFMDRRAAGRGNSHTDGDALYLHGHKIAWHGEYNGAACVYMTLAGYGTPTTRERLQGILTVMGHRSPLQRSCLSIHQQKYCQHISARALDGTVNTIRISTRDVLAVVHPSTATGLDAVNVLALAGWYVPPGGVAPPARGHSSVGLIELDSAKS